VSQNLTKQHNAIDLLVQGRTDQEVANLLKIRRESVNRWKNKCPFFQSALNKKRKELWEDAHMRLRSLINNATDTLKNAIDQGNWRAAVEALKILGLKGNVTPPSEAVDPLLVLLGQAQEWARLEMQKTGPSDDPFSDLLINDSHFARLVRKRMDELLKEHGLL
jgi:hypothetical protein